MSAIVGANYIRMEIWFIKNKESSVGNGGTLIDKKLRNKLCQKLNIFVNSKSGNINERKGFSNINRLRKYSKRYEVLLLLVCLTVFVGIHSYSAVDLCRPRLYCLNETNLSLKEKEYDRLEPFRVANIVLLEIHNVLYKFIIPQHHNRKILVKLLYHFALVLYQYIIKYYNINYCFYKRMFIMN